MPILAIVILGIVQGLAELLPVSSSAHVIVAEKLLGLDPTSPEMTLLLAMLHTGTMFAMILYFWAAWRRTFFSSIAAFKSMVPLLIFSTLITVLVGYPIIYAIEKIFLRNVEKAEIEMIFGDLRIMAAALAAAGILIYFSGYRRRNTADGGKENLGWRDSGWIGAIQGLCLPFRGFSRSGATISTGLLLGIARPRAEEFSFALAVILTPPVVLREVLRLLKARHELAAGAGGMMHLFLPSLLGMVVSFLAGLVALAWLSRWLEKGRWHFFGIYCLLASVGVLTLHLCGW
jgi:undecaprenyl-diphosphatase